MSTKLEALVDVLKADGIETAEAIEQLIVENFTTQNRDEYEIEGNIYAVLDQREIDNLLYDHATTDAENLKSDMEYSLEKHNNYDMIRMLETMNEDKCIDIMLNSYTEDTLEEKEKMSLILEEGGYFIYIKD